MKSIALTFILAAGTLTALPACACTGTRAVSTEPTEAAECVDTSIESLPISADEIYAVIEAETGYGRSELQVERICKYGDEYLFGFYPLASKNQFQRTILMSIGADGSIRFVPSM